METTRDIFKIVIIGAGNVATHLTKRLQKKGHEILQIVSRSEKNAEELSLHVNAPYTTDIKKINKEADIYFLCTPDDAIEQIANTLKLPKKLVIHTSGSVDMQVLKKISGNIGVVYPLQSFSKQVKISFASVPLLIEADREATLIKIKALASSLSKQVSEVNSANRLKLHLAATIANNFTNHLYTLSYEFLTKEKLNLFHLLMPLIRQSAKKIKTQKPSAVQTGPAKRGDTKTIQKHLLLLKKYPAQKQVYELFTELIKKQYHE